MVGTISALLVIESSRTHPKRGLGRTMAETPEIRKTYYDILGVTGAATPQELETAFRRLAMQCHPDVCEDAQDAAGFKLLVEAYEVLADPEKRRHYDEAEARKRRLQSSSAPVTHLQPHGVACPNRMADLMGPASPSEVLQAFMDSMLFSHRMRTRVQRCQHPELNVESELPVTPEEARRGTVAELKLRFEEDSPPRFLKIRVPAGIWNGSVLRVRGGGKRSLDGTAVGDLILRIRLRPFW